MKTTYKVQKTGNTKFNKVLVITLSAIVGFALISSKISTRINNSNEIHKVESCLTRESNFTSLPEISKVEEIVQYNPEKFVKAEMAVEIGCNNEAAETESALQIEILTNESKYNADNFVEEEIRLKNETRINNEDFIEAAESYTIDGSDQEVAKYARKVTNKS